MYLPRTKLFGRLAFSLLLICSIGFGAAVGLIFVYTSDLPEIRALEDYRPNVVTELYADDGQPIATFALQRRILITGDQIPKVLKDALLSMEDEHFEEHFGVDVPRVVAAAWRNLLSGRVKQGASTLTMQLAGGLFLDRSNRSLKRKLQEALLAVQIERHYTKAQILEMYCNQIYLYHGNYGFEAASEYYFSKPAGQLTLPEAALLVAVIPGPSYSPILHPNAALERRDRVLAKMARDGKITKEEAATAVKAPIGLHVSTAKNELAPYFVEDIRQYLEHTYGTEAVHERGLRVYTTLNVAMQKAAEQAVRDGLHSYDRRHGWRGDLPNILQDQSATLDSYRSDDWRGPIERGSYVTGLVTAASPTYASVKIGAYHATVTPADFSWTGHTAANQLFRPGDLGVFYVQEISGSTLRVRVEQQPQAQAALIAIDNASGEIKAMVGGYSFEESKFNRADQALRQTGSSFKVYVYAAALEQGASPFDTVVDQRVTFRSGGQEYSPHNYDERFEGRITLRRALADSRNIPAVELADRIGIQRVIDVARRIGITSPLPPYLPLALGAADLTLLEHTSAFTVFPDDGIHVQPILVRRVTTYDGALLEEAKPKVTDVISPQVARTMVAMLEEVVQFGTGIRAKELGRPSAGKTGTTNDFTDAWYIGFTPRLTAGVWVGNDDKRVSLGKKETGARAALPVWLEFMKQVTQNWPVEDFPNVTPLEKLAPDVHVQVDTPDTAAAADPAEQGLPGPPAAPPAPAQQNPAPPNGDRPPLLQE